MEEDLGFHGIGDFTIVVNILLEVEYTLFCILFLCLKFFLIVKNFSVK